MTRQLLLALGLTGWAICASAAAPGATPSQYDIEVIVFETRLPELTGDERWTREPAKPLPGDLAQASVAPDAVAEESNLSATLDALKKDPHYRLLTHKRWQQSADPRSESRPIRLQREPELDGQVRFYQSRYLYLDLNLQLKDTQLADTSYRLSEHRRVKIQETHYFDHPKFGVIVRVTQVGKN
jgi:hypothetical protein